MEDTSNKCEMSTVNDFPTNSMEESSFTMLDILEEERELEEEYAAVLGASDEKSCTYGLGTLKRQALYSCLTCCPEGRNNFEKAAGICLGCSYQCHDNHELIELYTKRNFRCDCPTDRTGENICALNNSLKQPVKFNSKNVYNQNFQGLYCACNRPYPDPERTTNEIMLQCVICEDWFHLQHLNARIGADILFGECSEMVCGFCMGQHQIIQNYTGLELKMIDSLDEAADGNLSVGDTDSTIYCKDNDDKKLKSDLDKSISKIMNMSETRGSAAEKSEHSDKRPKLGQLEAKEQICRRPNGRTEYKEGPTFWGPNWRLALCRCSTCISIYEAEKIEFLLDPEDSAKRYEERGIQKHGNASTYEQGIRALASIDRVHQIDAITEYNRMKDKLKAYLQTFVESKKVVTEEDINRFFAEMRNEKKVELGLPHLCR